MANPRRTSYSATTNHHHQLPISDTTTAAAGGSPFQAQQTQYQRLLTSIKQFLKKPHAFPLLLSVLLFLTWASLRIQYQHEKQHSNASSSSSSSSYNLKSGLTIVLDKDDKDGNANVVRFSSSSKTIMKDKRGWLLNPVSVALHAGIKGGAVACQSVHLGEIRPGAIRGNHRHHFCNETFIIWGAKTVFRLENTAVNKGYAQVTIGPDEVAVAASPSGTAHALVNVDPIRTTFFIGCQDSVVSYNDSSTDFKVWKDL